MAVGAAPGFGVQCLRPIAHILADWGPGCNLKTHPLMLHFQGCKLAQPPKDSTRAADLREPVVVSVREKPQSRPFLA